MGKAHQPTTESTTITQGGSATARTLVCFRYATIAVSCLALGSCASRRTAPPGTPDPVGAAPPSTVSDTTQFAVWEASIADLQRAMTEGRVTSQELVQSYMHRIAAYDRAGPNLNTMIRLNPQALAEAAALDKERSERGPRGPLHGIPIVIKDNFDTQDMPTTAGSISLAGATPRQDGFVVARLRAAGAVLLGKTNMMEFALGVYTISSIGGPTRNPYDPARSPGGSSGGTAAAVAASFAAVGWGTDTCGSIRVPAAFNSLFGLRPTKGITSTRGIVPLCPTMDVSSAMARTVADLAIALDATVGLDSAEPAAAQWQGRAMPSFVSALDSTALRGARLGVLTQFFGQSDAAEAISDSVRSAIARMQAAGATIVQVSIPGIDSIAPSGNVVAFEFRDELKTYLTRQADAPVQSLNDILTRGLYLSQLHDDYTALNTSPDTSSVAYKDALARRADLQRRLQKILTDQRLDALVYPTVRHGPNPIGVPQMDPNCELSANSGFPAFSVPVGFTDDGLPVGMELIGAPLSDARLLALGYAWEKLANPRQPPLYTPQLHLVSAPPPAQVGVVVTADSMRATITFVFDASTGRLTYNVRVLGLLPPQLLAISLHQGLDSAMTGPVIAPLAGPGGVATSGTLTLDMPARQALHHGRLYVTVLTTTHPRGSLRGQVPPPATPPIVRPLPPPIRPS